MNARAAAPNPLVGLGIVTGMNDKAARSLAERAGEIHHDYLEAFWSAYEDAKGDDATFSRRMTATLAKEGCIGRDEKTILDKIIDAVLNRKLSVADTVKEVEGGAKSLRADATTSPAAIAIAEIALDSIKTVAKENKGKDGGGAQADVMGALGGAVAGSKGGVWGMLLVGIAVGVAASWGAKKDAKDKKGT